MQSEHLDLEHLHLESLCLGLPLDIVVRIVGDSTGGHAPVASGLLMGEPVVGPVYRGGHGDMPHVGCRIDVHVLRYHVGQFIVLLFGGEMRVVEGGRGVAGDAE